MIQTKTIKGILAFSIAGLFLLYEFVLQVSPQVMADGIIKSFDTSAALYGTMAAMYFYAYAPGQLFTGASYDKFGAKWTLLVSCLLCTLGSLLIYSVHNVYMFGLGRALSGLGSASAFVGAIYIGKQYFGTENFSLVVGITELLGCLGAIVGIVPLAILVSHVGWVDSMLIFTIIGALLIISISLLVNKKDQVQFKADTPHNSARKRVAAIFKNNQTWAIGLYALTLFAPVTILASLWGVPFLRSMGYRLETASIAIAIIWIGIAIGSLLFSVIAERVRKRKPLLISFPIIGMIASLMVIYLASNYILLILFLFTFGVAISGQALSFNVVSDNNAHENLGTAMGFHNMLIVFSGAVFQPIASYLINWFNATSGHYSYASFAQALAIIPVIFFISGIIAIFWLKETKTD